MTELPLAPPAAATTALAASERALLVRRARLLAWSGNAWHLIEFAIAVGAGLAAGSIEAAAGGVIVWRFAAPRSSSEHAERRAQQLIAATYFLLAIYVGEESVRTLAAGSHPRAS